jgi:hypothetical protein
MEVQQQYEMLEQRRQEQRRQEQRRPREPNPPREATRPKAEHNLPAAPLPQRSIPNAAARSVLGTASRQVGHTNACPLLPARANKAPASSSSLVLGVLQGYMRPTVAWRSHVESRRQEAQSTARAAVLAGSGLPFNAVPFVAGTSTEPSQSLAGNLQQILAMLKQQGRPLHPRRSAADPLPLTMARAAMLTLARALRLFDCSETEHPAAAVPGVQRHLAADFDEKRNLLQQAREAQTQLRLADLQWLPASSA